MAKVLVVDDSLSVRKVVERALEARQINVLSVGLGIEAIERIERESPDLVVCDVLLPDKDGYQICEFVKTHPRLGGTPVLLMSGIVNDSVLERAARVKSDKVMRKPFAAEELAQMVDALLAASTTGAPLVPSPTSGDGGDGDEAAASVAPVPPPAERPAGAVALLDPTETPTAPYPPADHEAAVTAPAATIPETRGERPERGAPSPGFQLKTCLVQLTAITGVRLAVLADREGFLIESAGAAGVETEVTGALASCLAESSDGLGRELGQGTLQGIILEYEGGMVLLHGVGSTALLAILLRDPAALGKVRYYARKVLPDLARAL